MSLYKKSLVRVQLVREKSPRKLVSSPALAVELVKNEMQSFDREYLVCVYLDTSNRVAAIEESAKGTIDRAPVCPRDIFKSGILSNSSSLIVLHNHPSGSCKPSEDDIKATDILKKAGELIGIALIDHIIVGAEGGYYSFQENGLIHE
jgi:DNA repair protein RadC